MREPLSPKLSQSELLPPFLTSLLTGCKSEGHRPVGTFGEALRASAVGKRILASVFSAVSSWPGVRGNKWWGERKLHADSACAEQLLAGFDPPGSMNQRWPLVSDASNGAGALPRQPM